MGNCYGFSSGEPRPTTAPHPSSSSGVSGPSSTNRGFSQSSSSAGNSRFSLAASASSDGEILETPNLRIFSFAELKAATKGFRPDNLLGIGGFGMVYRGWIDDRLAVPSKSSAKTIVAIKKMNPNIVQGFEQWQSEVNFLGSLSHSHLVRLLGYCCEDGELLLVYEYMPRGSFENYLFRRSAEPLSWDRRISIALGAARGLAFLHSLDRKVIYRDFKTSNILLDGSYIPKLSDFGLAKFGPPPERSHLTTRVMGTYGYAAPEYVATGHLYVNSDVYGFGVVLLEMLTGLRVIDPNRPEHQQNLVNWLGPRLHRKKKLSSIMDRRMEGQYPIRAAQEVAQLTVKCLQPDPRSRPSTKEVVDALQQIEAMRETRIGSRNTSSSSSSSTARRPVRLPVPSVE